MWTAFLYRKSILMSIWLHGWVGLVDQISELWPNIEPAFELSYTRRWTKLDMGRRCSLVTGWVRVPKFLWEVWAGKSMKYIPVILHMREWWMWALLRLYGVAPSQTVGVSASVNLPFHRIVQKFSSGTSSPGWSRKKGHKTVVVWWW